ncbi:HlyU family transcriptional regulator [Rhizobium sp. BR 315]|uniref:HlyU family transcriptional regulator n=1 Tax=Rhizobium sp. BR 315 TaxID=3040014 RepID=UPI003D3597F9
MASFFSNIISIFTGGAAQPGTEKSTAPAVSAEPQLHAGCTIYATPQREGNQFRLMGRIEKDVNGEMLVRTFIRADVFTSSDDAVESAFRKAQQIIDQNGASLFGDGEKTRQV